MTDAYVTLCRRLQQWPKVNHVQSFYPPVELVLGCRHLLAETQLLMHAAGLPMPLGDVSYTGWAGFSDRTFPTVTWYPDTYPIRREVKLLFPDYIHVGVSRWHCEPQVTARQLASCLTRFLLEAKDE